MAKDDYFVILYVLLDYLYTCIKSGENPDLNFLNEDRFNINRKYWFYILENAKDDGLIKGIDFVLTKQGKIFNNKNLEITPKGIEFLIENSMMNRVKNTFKDIKDIIPFI